MKATIRIYNTKGKEHENLVQTQRSIWNKEVTSKNPGVVCVYIYLLRTSIYSSLLGNYMKRKSKKLHVYL